jgi:RimJ/RimL family protein N-acetyltransferase
VLLRPLDPDRDASALYAASHRPEGDPAVWTYLAEGPYQDIEEMRRALTEQAASDDPLFFTLVPVATEVPGGIASYMRIVPQFGVIEIGNIWFGPGMQRTTAATEAIYLLARHAFRDLGYRRLEWKCNALNEASRRAAVRFGFTFEGVFRHHMVLKGRNRDTAWYAIVDSEWPRIQTAFEQWLAAENFDPSGRQRQPLAAFIR